MSVRTAQTLPKKILVVDDDSQIRRALRTILASQGCVVIEARESDEAIEEIRAECPDLVLLDVNMPAPTALKRAGEFELFPMWRSSW
jgi:CheY-like chemotaxis protein